jgi:hypothetical protein
VSCPITHWSARELKDEVLQQGIVSSISERHIHRLLNATDLQPHRCRYWLNAKPDPQKDSKIRAVSSVYLQFTNAGGVPASNIARWNGSNWSALGSGVSVTPNGAPAPVQALAADGLGHLFVGGNFYQAGTNLSPFIA